MSTKPAIALEAIEANKQRITYSKKNSSFNFKSVWQVCRALIQSSLALKQKIAAYLLLTEKQIAEFEYSPLSLSDYFAEKGLILPVKGEMQTEAKEIHDNYDMLNAKLRKRFEKNLLNEGEKRGAQIVFGEFVATLRNDANNAKTWREMLAENAETETETETKVEGELAS